MGVTNEPPSIQGGGENPDSWSHWEIYNSFNPLNTTAAHQCSQDYSKLATGWDSAVTFFNARIKQSSDAAWQGKAADASRTAISNYTTRALDLCDSLNAMSTQVSSAIDGVNNTKNGTDKPIQHIGHWSTDGDFLGWHGDHSLRKINSERDKAREAMKNNYIANFVAADKQIPQVPKPNEITNPLYSYTATSGNPYSGPSNSNSGNQNNGNSTSSTSYSGSGSDSGSQSGTSSSDSTSPSSYQSSNTSSSLSTIPSSYYSGLSSSLSTTPSSFTSGTGTGSGSGGYDGGTTTNSGGGLGKSVTGTGSTTTGTTAAAATKAGTSTTGMTGMGGMGGMGGAGKGKGEEDTDHSLPEWLRNMENTEELLGPQPKTIPGGVIGGDYNEDPNART